MNFPGRSWIGSNQYPECQEPKAKISVVYTMLSVGRLIVGRDTKRCGKFNLLNC